jgi:hypothetical protein
METFFQRLKVYTGAPLTERQDDVIIQLMAQVLLILAVFTKSINQRRSSEFSLGTVSYFTDGFDSAIYFRPVRSFTLRLGPKIRSLSTSERQLSWSFNSRKRQGAIKRLDKLIQEEEGLGTVEPRSYSPNFFLVAHRHSNMRAGGKTLENVKLWLSPPDPSQKYNTILGVHHEGTNTWLFKNDTYNQWKSRGSLLWISGLRSCISALLQIIC